MNSEIGQESLLQRGRTPLLNDLVYLYQNTHDALRDNPRASGKETNIALKSLRFVEDLKAIIKKHMNLPIAKIIITESMYPNAMAGISYKAGKGDPIKSKTTTYGMIIQKVNDFYDDKKAFLDEGLDKLNFELTLLLTTSFWTIRKKDKDFYFTAEELAAVTLHELGHFDHWFRTIAKIHSKILDASEIVSYLESNPDKEVILQILQKVKDSKSLDKSWNPVLSATENYFKKTNSFDGQEYLEAINTLSTVVAAGASRYTLNRFNQELSVYHRPTNLGTVSPGMKDSILDAERSADEFSSRNGAYEYLAKGLLKLTDLYENNYKLVTAQRSFYKQYFLFTALQQFNKQLSYYAEDILTGYDPLIRRVSLIIETAKHSFSDSDLPEDVKSEIMTQIKNTESYFKDYKNSNRSAFREKFKRWIKEIERFGRIIRSPFENRLRDDYDILQESTRHLSRNPLHYIAKS